MPPTPNCCALLQRHCPVPQCSGPRRPRRRKARSGTSSAHRAAACGSRRLPGNCCSGGTMVVLDRSSGPPRSARRSSSSAEVGWSRLTVSSSRDSGPISFAVWPGSSQAWCPGQQAASHLVAGDLLVYGQSSAGYLTGTIYGDSGAASSGRPCRGRSSPASRSPTPWWS